MVVIYTAPVQEVNWYSTEIATDRRSKKCYG